MTNDLISIVAAAALASAPPTHAPALKGAELVAQAKVKLVSARSTALRVRPGKVTDEELEREKGGSGLRYSFDIKAKGVTYEVGVDAKTGAVLENAAEGAHPD